jgi:hypothetical protein
VSALLVGACSKKNDPVANVRQAAADRDLQKTFSSDCQATPGEAIATGIGTLFQGKNAGQKVTYKFTGANVSKKTEVYSTTNCTGDANYTLTESGTFTVHKDANKKTNDGGYPIDLKFDKMQVNIVSDVGAKTANEKNLCGAKDWAPGKDRDVTKQAQDNACAQTKIPRTVANIYRVDNNVLTLGSDTSNKDVPDKQRPASLDKTKYTAR